MLTNTKKFYSNIIIANIKTKDTNKEIKIENGSINNNNNAGSSYNSQDRIQYNKYYKTIIKN